MKKMMIPTLAGILIAFLAFQYPGDTLEKSARPFDLNDYEWLVGHWQGDGFGGVSEEIWAPAVDGTMMGMYRHYKDGKLVFYEFLLLDETGLKLKHFNPDLTGWETQEEFVTFPMVAHSENLLELKGLTFELKSEDQLEIRLKMRQSGELTTEVFTMNKLK